MSKEDKNKVDIKQAVAEVTENMAETEAEEKEKVSLSAKLNPQITWLSEDTLQVDQKQFQLVLNHRDAFDVEAFTARYSDILDKYDFIVGDWGFEQLRLKGFYQSEEKVRVDQKIVALEDYIYEYCNFGCAYFVLARLDKPERPERPEKSYHNNNRKRPNKNNNQNRNQKNRRNNTSNNQNKNTQQHAYIKEKRVKEPVKNVTKKEEKVVTREGNGEKRHFTIRTK